jgi:uncharacterized membrane protein
MTKTLIAALALTCLSTFAQAQSCAVQAGDKKLNGAAKTSFLTKCQKDAGATCDRRGRHLIAHEKGRLLRAALVCWSRL